MKRAHEAEALDASDEPKGCAARCAGDYQDQRRPEGPRHKQWRRRPSKRSSRPDDAPVVRNLKAAGAVVIGRTNTPEFSFRADTDNPALSGVRNNPWGTSPVSAGGSSGGAGSAVMAGMGALAHGNDIGGSLRFPASANGSGHREARPWASPRMEPRARQAERGLLAQSMSVQGLIARNGHRPAICRCPALDRYPDPRDPFHVPLPWRGPAASERPHQVLPVSRDDFGFGLHRRGRDSARRGGLCPIERRICRGRR
jgi:amidase